MENNLHRIPIFLLSCIVIVEVSLYEALIILEMIII